MLAFSNDYYGMIFRATQSVELFCAYEKQGVTEELKMQNQMAWVGKMNNIRACTEEIVVKDILYAEKNC